jgi:hypothetical protein
LRVSAVLPLLVAGLAGCTQSHIVRPLGKGNGVVNASLGGPFVHVFGLDIPAPIFTAGGGYGVRDDLDVYANLDVTALAFGLLHVEPGVVLHPVIRESGAIPTVSVGASLHLITDFRDARAVPNLMGALAWRYKRHMLYVGGDLGFGFGASREDGERAFRFLGGPFVGGEVRAGKRVGLALELKWLAPQSNVAFAAPEWVSPGSQGYFSLLIGINVYIGDVK